MSEAQRSRREEDQRRKTYTRRNLVRGAIGGIGTIAPVTIESRGVRAATGSRRSMVGSSQTGSTEVIYWTQSTGLSLDAQKRIVAAFNAANPTIAVKLVQIPNTSSGGPQTDITKLLTAVRAGTGPDVYFLNRYQTQQYAANGVLTDLMPYLQGENLSEQYLPFAWQEALYQGKTYALPFDTDSRALYYRKDLLSQAGATPDELDPKNGPLTIDRVVELAAKVDRKDANGNYTRMGFIPWFDQGFFYTWVVDFGGTLVDRKDCKITATNPEVVQAFQLMYDRAKALGPKQVQTFLASYNLPGAPPQQSPFITGRLAMVITGNWQIANLAKYAPQLGYGVTYIPVPKAGAKPTTWAGGYSFAIPKDAKHPDAAYKFMRYIAGPDGQRIYVQQANGLPTWKGLLDDPNLFPGNVAFFAQELLPIARPHPLLPQAALLWDELKSAQEKVTLNESQPKDALQEVEHRVQPQLQRYCPIT